MWIVTTRGTRINTDYLTEYEIAKDVEDDVFEFAVFAAAGSDSRIVGYVLFGGTYEECRTFVERLDSALGVRTINIGATNGNE